MTEGWKVFLVVLACLVAFGFLCTVFSGFRKVLVLFLRGSFWAVAIPLEVLWLVLAWWWLAIAKKARGGTPPPAWLFSLLGRKQ